MNTEPTSVISEMVNSTSGVIDSNDSCLRIVFAVLVAGIWRREPDEVHNVVVEALKIDPTEHGEHLIRIPEFINRIRERKLWNEDGSVVIPGTKEEENDIDLLLELLVIAGLLKPTSEGYRAIRVGDDIRQHTSVKGWHTNRLGRVVGESRNQRSWRVVWKEDALIGRRGFGKRTVNVPKDHCTFA